MGITETYNVTSTVKTLEQALKTQYLDPIIKMINEDNGPLFAAIEKTSEPISGETVKFALQYARHGGIGARGENDDLPVPSPRSYIQAQISPKFLTGRINFSDKLMRVSKDDKASFVDQVSVQMEDLTTDLKDMMRRNLFGTSEGVMAKVASLGGDGKSVVIEGNSRVFYPGQKIEFYTATDTDQTLHGTEPAVIANVDHTSKTLYFNAAIDGAVAAGDKIGLVGNWNNELTGLGDIFTVDNTIYGVDRSKYKWFNPQVFDKGTDTAFSSMFMQEAIDAIDDFRGTKPNFITCNAGVLRAYMQEQLTYKRNTEYKVLDGGVRIVSYDDVAIVKDKYMPANTMYFLNTDDFSLAQLNEWEWMDQDGAVLHRVANKAAYEATILKYCELICRVPGAQATLTGIKEA